MNLKQRIDELVEEHGSLREVSRVTGIDIGYLSCLDRGIKYNPLNTTCTALGLKKRMVIEYTLI